MVVHRHLLLTSNITSYSWGVRCHQGNVTGYLGNIKTWSVFSMCCTWDATLICTYLCVKSKNLRLTTQGDGSLDSPEDTEWYNSEDWLHENTPQTLHMSYFIRVTEPRAPNHVCMVQVKTKCGFQATFLHNFHISFDANDDIKHAH